MQLFGTWLPSRNSRNSLGQIKRAYLSLLGVLCSKFNLSLNLKFFYNWFPISMTKGAMVTAWALLCSCPALLLTLFSNLWSLIFFLCLKGFYLCP